MPNPDPVKPAGRSRKTTLHDVAARVGVSYQTVSRVINDHPNVASDTRAKVARAIRELGYVPNRAAQSLVTRRTRTVGIVSYGTRFYGPAQMVANIEASLRAEGYDLLFTTTDDLSRPELRKNIARLEGQLVDGLVLITPLEGVHLAELSRAIDIPYVVIDVPLGEDLPSVVIDQRYGSQLVTEHLVHLGHRTIGQITGPLGWCGADLRDEGWKRALAAAGLPRGRVAEGDWTVASGHAAAERLLDEGSEFTALVVGNDQMALGAMAALRAAGLSVPGDVSVVGFDDVPEAAYFAPPLTTVRQDFVALGRQSAEYLLERIADRDAPAEQRVLRPELVLRESTAPPR